MVRYDMNSIFITYDIATRKLKIRVEPIGAFVEFKSPLSIEELEEVVSIAKSINRAVNECYGEK